MTIAEDAIDRADRMALRYHGVLGHTYVVMYTYVLGTNPATRECAIESTDLVSARREAVGRLQARIYKQSWRATRRSGRLRNATRGESKRVWRRVAIGKKELPA